MMDATAPKVMSMLSTMWIAVLLFLQAPGVWSQDDASPGSHEVSLESYVSPRPYSPRPYSPRPYMGFQVHFKSAGEVKGIWVVEVDPDGPAGVAGLMPDDVIVGINGSMPSFQSDLEMIDFLQTFDPGQILALRVYRNSELKNIDVTVGRMKNDDWNKLSEWKSSAIENGQGEDGAACCDKTTPPVVKKDPAMSPRWAQTLRNVAMAGKPLRLLVSMEQSRKISITASEPGIVPGKLFPDDLQPPEYRQKVLDLNPGESLAILISFDPDLFEWTIRLD